MMAIGAELEGDPLRRAGLLNFRDTGGVAVAPGVRLRKGLVYRSDSLHHLVEPGATYLLERLGVRHVIDLRAGPEIAMDGRGDLGAMGVRYSAWPMPLTSASPTVRLATGEFLGRRYMEFLDQAPESIIGAIRSLGETDGTPAVIHCSAGKDRTGVVVATLLDLLGVPHEAIVRDYQKTSIVVSELRARHEAMRGPTSTDLPVKIHEADASTIRHFLGEAGRVHGGLPAWAARHGLGAGELADLKRKLLEAVAA